MYELITFGLELIRTGFKCEGDMYWLLAPIIYSDRTLKKFDQSFIWI